MEAYREKLGHLQVFLGNVDVEEITITDLRSFVADQMDRTKVYEDHPKRDPKKGSLSPFTVASRVRHFKRLFNWLEEERIIQENPARRIHSSCARSGAWWSWAS